MDLWEAIEKRRTIRKFSAPPTEQQLDRLLNAAAKAPSAHNRQAWFAVIINDLETKEKFSSLNQSGYIGKSGRRDNPFRSTAPQEGLRTMKVRPTLYTEWLFL